MNNQWTRSRRGFSLALLLGSAVLLSSTGCQVAQDGTGKRLPLFALPGAAESREIATAERGPMYRVEIIPVNGRGKSMQLPLAQGQTVQHALEKAGARRQFGKMKIELVRLDPTTGQQIKMGVEYQARKKRVLPNYDYAVMPGDRIIIREDTSSALDGVFGPLTGLFRR